MFPYWAQWDAAQPMNTARTNRDELDKAEAVLELHWAFPDTLAQLRPLSNTSVLSFRRTAETSAMECGPVGASGRGRRVVALRAGAIRTQP